MTRKVAKAMIRHADTGKYLLVRPIIVLPWGFSLVGGGIHDGETPENALRREMQEEVGILNENILSLEMLPGPFTSPWRFGYVPSNTYLFEIVTNTDPGALRTNWEVISAIWLDFDQIESNLNSHYRDLFEFFYGTGKRS
jgi:8-oxo-dGTP pyrophosphatase MutT (NUDIX family)